MSEEKLLTVREVSHILNLTEREVMDIAENSIIPAYKVGGVYLRFKRSQVEDYRRKLRENAKTHQEFSLKDRVLDFFYFYDFYILSFVLVILMLYIIFR